MRIQTAAPVADRALVDVGGKHLQRGLAGVQLHLIVQQHRQAVGFFAGGTAGGPDTYFFFFLRLCRSRGGVDQLRHHIPLEGFEGFAVTEEVGHTDQHVAQQRLGFLGIVLQEFVIGGEVRLRRDLHPAFDASQYRGTLVVFEIMAGASAQLNQNVMQHLLGRRGIALGHRGNTFHLLITDRGQADFPGVAPQLQQLLRHFNHRQHEVDHARIDGGFRHPVELGVFRRLDQGDATLFLDARQADRAIRAGARQYQAERAFTVHIGQVAEEQIDRRVTSQARVDRADLKQTVIHVQLLRRRNDVDPVLFDRHRAADLQDRHLG
ncbi:hypothetical protein D3C84_404400 [compost metagenome]